MLVDHIWLQMLGACALASAITYYLVPRCIAVAHKFNILDHPNGTVKTHSGPTAYLGGVAVYLGFLVSVGLVFPFDNQFFLFFIGSSILFFVGIIDDLMPLDPLHKFMGQILAVIIFLKGGIYVKAHFLMDIPTIVLSALWMLFVINTINLIDIMDGLATTVSLFCAGMFCIVALIACQYTIALLLALFMGSLGAFLLFNAPRASIYLGDAGSLFIGGMLSVMPFFINWGSLTRYGFITPLIILAIPLLEGTFLIIIRTYKGIPFYKPSPDHFAIKLKLQGYRPEEVLFLVSCASIVLMVVAILFISEVISLLHVIPLGILYATIWTHCIYLKQCHQLNFSIKNK
jgi:UDP-GlcNAc:undecaprenyl-phosphate GlcNAc-1-phosphate transferase